MQVLDYISNVWENRHEVIHNDRSLDQIKVKSNIRRILGVSSHVNAEECDVKVDGQCVSLVEKHTEQVIAYAVFSKSRFNIEEEWEMTSYVVKDFMIVDNGLKRILDAFAETFAPSSITAFIDRRWNDGAEYENCGFKLVKTLDPQCWWFNKTTLHRYHENDFKRNIAHDLLNQQFVQSNEQLNKLNELRWCRIYDCGKLKMTKTF